MHDRILHRHLQLLALAGARAVEQRADDAERHQHAGAGVADRRAGLDRPPARLAGDAHRAARGLRDRVEREPLLVRAAGAEALDLGVDDAGIDRADDIVAEPQPLDRAGREILGEDIGLLHHLLDQRQPALGFQVDGERALVGVVHHEIVGVAEAGAAGLAARRLDLGDVGAHPGERLGAGRAGLELRQVEDANAGQKQPGDTGVTAMTVSFSIVSGCPVLRKRRRLISSFVSTIGELRQERQTFASDNVEGANNSSGATSRGLIPCSCA